MAPSGVLLMRYPEKRILRTGRARAEELTRFFGNVQQPDFVFAAEVNKHSVRAN
jgi:hypothetical protein